MYTSISLPLYIYIHTHACMHAYTLACLHACIHTYIHPYLPTYITYSSTNHFFQCLENFHTLTPSTAGSVSNSSRTHFTAQAR